jgi:hypothetical protein
MKNMKNMKKLFFVFILLLLSFTVYAEVPIAQIQAMLDKPKELCGNFDQTKLLVGINKPLKSNGTFCVNSQTGVVWKTLKPFPNTLKLTRTEIIQTQGDQVTLDLDSTKEPVVRMINTVLFSLLAGNFNDLDKLFILNGHIEHNTWHVALTARDPALAKAIGNISLDGSNHVHVVNIAESNGDKTLITFSAIKNHA